MQRYSIENLFSRIFILMIVGMISAIGCSGKNLSSTPDTLIPTFTAESCSPHISPSKSVVTPEVTMHPEPSPVPSPVISLSASPTAIPDKSGSSLSTVVGETVQTPDGSLSSGEVPSDMIIDHRVTHALFASGSLDLAVIPERWIEKAKEDLHIAYGHTSHGSQLISGMNGLMRWKGNLYAWDDEGGLRGSLDLDDYAFSEERHDLGHNGDLEWERLTRKYLDDPANSDVNVVMWSWCGGVSDNTEDGIDIYLNAMNQLEKDYPNVTFVYMTGHADGTGETGNLHLRNQQIREYCRANGKILYDFYDIECYDPDGNYYGDKDVNDNCDYAGGNWAIEWQNSHVQNVDWYYCYAAHSQPLNANLKAYAAWWLFARLAGWDGAVSKATLEM